MYQKATLDNGLRVITANMPHTRSVSVCFFTGTGSRYETEAQAGISHFIEHMCFKGTTLRPTPQEISAAIEGTGGALNAGTDKELTIYWCKVAQPHFLLALDVLSDILLNSKFDREEIEKERQVIIEEINMCNDSPQQRVALLIDEILWYHHPLGRDITGSKESVSALTRDMLLDYMAGYYQPANTVLSIAGDIQHEEAISAVSKFLGNWKNQRPRHPFLAYEDTETPHLRIEIKDTEQTNLCLALPGLPLLHPKRFALDLLNVVLGEGMSSRLFAEIRDKLGLAYSVHSFVDHFLDTGSIIVSAGVETGKLQLAIKAILAELSKLKETITEAELNKAKEFSKGRLILRMEDSHNVAGFMGGQEILTGHILTVNDLISIVDAITIAEVQQVAGDLLRGEKLRLAVVGPLKPEEPLEELLKL